MPSLQPQNVVDAMTHRPQIDPPAQIAHFVSRLGPLAPVELWLFGSRARGDARPNSDWDLLAVVEDNAPERMTDPVFAWEIARASDVPVTLLVTRRSDLAEIWGRPNTLGFDIAREGIKLRVD